VLLLDKSGSMDFDSGDGRKRINVLHSAATTFANLIQDANGIGIASFAVSTSPDMPVQVAGGAFGAGRSTAKNKILAHTPLNERTSIGNGLEEAHNLLDPVGEFDTKAMIVLTDGHENEPKWIADVSGLINEFVYAIGLGTADQIRPAALDALVSGTGGYLELTGNMSVDDQFRLEKYYLQILASVTNTDIVVDPQDRIQPGQTHRIPFNLNETDISTDAILLTRVPDAIAFMLETPDGDIIAPSTVGGIPGILFRQGEEVSFYRVSLPLPIGGKAARSGKWHAILHIDPKHWKKLLHRLRKEMGQEAFNDMLTHGVEYSFNAHAYSNLRMRPTLTQNSYEPGATLTLRAVLTEYGLPLGPGRAALWTDLTRPDDSTTTLVSSEVEPGVFETSVTANMPGTYRFRLHASGQTLRARVFNRDMLLTAGVYHGGDRPTPGSDPSDDPRRPNERLCELLKCLVSDRVFGKCLKECGVEIKVLEECLARYCRSRSGPRSPRKANLATVLPQLEAMLGPDVLRQMMEVMKEKDGG
jgi:hypothetical protein